MRKSLEHVRNSKDSYSYLYFKKAPKIPNWFMIGIFCEYLDDFNVVLFDELLVCSKNMIKMYGKLYRFF